MIIISFDDCLQTLDMVKQAKVAQILGSGGAGDRRRGPRVGSIESMHSESTDEVSY